MSFLTYAPIIISALSLCLALYSAISTYYEKHIKTKVYLRWCAQFADQLTICLLVSNMSSRPSTITNVKLKTSDNTYAETTWFPALLASSGKKEAYSDCTPLSIPPRSAKVFIVTIKHLEFFTLSATHINLRYTIDDVEFERTEEIKVRLDANQFLQALQSRIK